jgi:hypothetical protein
MYTLMDFIPAYEFRKCVQRYNGNQSPARYPGFISSPIYVLEPGLVPHICTPIAAGVGIDNKYAVTSIVTRRQVSLNISERIFGFTTLAERENADKNKIPRETRGGEKPSRTLI